jgi:hypothetical protein
MRRDKTGVEICDNDALAPGAHASRHRSAIPDLVGPDEKRAAKSIKLIDPFALDRLYPGHHTDDLRFLGSQPSGDTTVRHHEVMGHLRRAADGAADGLDMHGLLHPCLLEANPRLRRICLEALSGAMLRSLEHSWLSELDHLNEPPVGVRRRHFFNLLGQRRDGIRHRRLRRGGERV